MIGHPKYDYNDLVSFSILIDGKEREFVGSVEIIDAWGTFEQNTEVSYDIFVDNAFNGDPCLFKHILESHLRSVETQSQGS